MLPLSLDAILAFIFSIPIVMKYRVLPTEETPYWLFGILFIVCITHIVFSFFPNILKKQVIFPLKRLFIWITILITLLGPMVTSIVDRHKVAPVWGVHDIILQQEAAIRYLVRGKNPYKETYFGTPVESFNYDEMGRPAVNPALYHFVMPPGYLLFPLPIYFLANRLFGYFDGRMVLVLVVLAIGVVLQKSFRNPLVANISMILFLLSPATTDYLIEGRSDTFAIFWVLCAFVLLEKKNLLLSSIFLGFGILSKQTVWFAVPVYLLYLVRIMRLSFFVVIKHIIIIVFCFFLFSFPFIIWDSKAFFDSVIFYLSGNIKTGYPISGYGLSMLLYSSGIIKNIHDYFPFGIFQVIFGMGTFFLVYKYFFAKKNISGLWLSYGIFLFAIWYVSRYFNNSHIAYIGMLLTMAFLKQCDESFSSHG